MKYIIETHEDFLKLVSMYANGEITADAYYEATEQWIKGFKQETARKSWITMESIRGPKNRWWKIGRLS